MSWKGANPISNLQKRLSLISFGGAVAISLALAGNAHAVPIFSYLGAGTDYALPTTPGTPGFNPSGFVDAAETLNAGQTIKYFGPGDTGFGLVVDPTNVMLDFQFKGSEAGFDNTSSTLTLLFGSVSLFTNTSPYDEVKGAFEFDLAAPGFVPISFTSSGSGTAANGGLIDAGMNIGFWIESDTVAWVFLDDAGAGPDKDFDDLVIKITASLVPPLVDGETPLPAAAWLFGTVVAGAAGLRRWRRRKV